MSSSSPILVFGGTGGIASHIVSQLHKRGIPVVATVRDTAKAKAKLPSGVQLIEMDFKDAASIHRAVQNSGAKHAFGILDAVYKESLSAMKAGGLTHLVYVSTSFIGLPTETTALQQWQAAGEDVVKASGLTYTFLRAEAFMSNCQQSSTHALRSLLPTC